MSGLETAPMPGYRHPSLPDIDPDSTDLSVVRYIVPTTPVWAWYGADVKPTDVIATEARTLTLKKCWGPAPYVGRPFAYVWRALVTDDGTNRAIGGRARIAYKPLDYSDPATWLIGDPADDALA